MFNLDDIIGSFIILWAAIDPIGTLPVFVAVTNGYSKEKKLKIAKFSSFVAFCILLFFIIVGEVLLKSIGVSLSAFQISGGVVLFIFALSMIFGNSKPEDEMQLLKDDTETAIFPLAIPSIAGPGAILAVVLLTDNTRHSVLNQFGTVMILSVVLVVNYFVMRLATKIHDKIGNIGAIVISKVMGLILASMAANNILIGIKDFFKL